MGKSKRNRLEKWDQSRPSAERLRSATRSRATEPCQTGSDTELTTRSDTTPRGDTGEELRSDSECSWCLCRPEEKKNTFKVWRDSKRCRLAAPRSSGRASCKSLQIQMPNLICQLMR